MNKYKKFAKYDITHIFQYKHDFYQNFEFSLGEYNMHIGGTKIL